MILYPLRKVNDDNNSHPRVNLWIGVQCHGGGWRLLSLWAITALRTSYIPTRLIATDV
jgi:hypothetical protein